MPVQLFQSFLLSQIKNNTTDHVLGDDCSSCIVRSDLDTQSVIYDFLSISQTPVLKEAELLLRETWRKDVCIRNRFPAQRDGRVNSAQ